MINFSIIMSLTVAFRDNTVTLNTETLWLQ